MKDQDLYLMRAADAHAQAELADLENVRELCLQSEAVWKEMAARAERTEQLRAVNEAEKWNAREAALQEISCSPDERT